MNKPRLSTIIPVLMLIYLIVMGYMGLDSLRAGRYFYYFATIIIGLALIAILYYRLRKKEKARDRQRDEAEHGYYPNEEIPRKSRNHQEKN